MMSIQMKATPIPTAMMAAGCVVVMGVVPEGGVKLASIQASYMSLSSML